MYSPFDLAVLLLEIYPTGIHTPVQDDICTMLFTAMWFIIAKNGS